MKNNRLVIILFGCWLMSINAASLKEVTDIAKTVRAELDELCNIVNLTSHNVVASDLFFNILLKTDYSSLIRMSVKTKQAQLNLFNEQYCPAGSSELVSRDINDLGGYMQHLQMFLFSIQELKNFINLVFLESVMRIFGATYDFIISHDFVAKSAWLNDFVDFVLSPKKTLVKTSTSDYSVYVEPSCPQETKFYPLSADFYDVDVGPVLEAIAMPKESVEHAGYLATKREIGDSLIYSGNFLATVGKPWEGSVLQRPKNVVEKKEYPDLNKYNQGLEAIPLVILENNYGLFKKSVPAGIKANLVDIPDANVAFFVEISAGAGFDNKGRRYNMIFHGAMADWYRDEMGGFNFYGTENNGGFARRIPMGIFDFDGIEGSGGDIAKNALSEQDVNAHNGLYSPDNAGFIIQDGRQLVTFWSVAKSSEKRRAVVTFHILFDWNMPNDFKAEIMKISRNKHEWPKTDTLGGLLIGLMAASSLLSKDQDEDAWFRAITTLNALYKA